MKVGVESLVCSFSQVGFSTADKNEDKRGQRDSLVARRAGTDLHPNVMK